MVLRARPLHIDAKFNDGSQRLRFVCVHARVVVVRLTAYSDALRPIVPVDVDFEPGQTNVLGWICCCWSNLRLGIEPFDPRGSEEDSETVLARQLAAQTTEVVPTPPVSPPPENTLIDLSEFVDLNADSTATTSPPTSPVSSHNDTVVVPERRRSLPGWLEISFFFVWKQNTQFYVKQQNEIALTPTIKCATNGDEQWSTRTWWPPPTPSNRLSAAPRPIDRALCRAWVTTNVRQCDRLRFNDVANIVPVWEATTRNFLFYFIFHF